jgi:hypothetical protein
MQPGELTSPETSGQEEQPQCIEPITRDTVQECGGLLGCQ